jgi:hypothetical protein
MKVYRKKVAAKKIKLKGCWTVVEGNCFRLYDEDVLKEIGKIISDEIDKEIIEVVIKEAKEQEEFVESIIPDKMFEV